MQITHTEASGRYAGQTRQAYFSVWALKSKDALSGARSGQAPETGHQQLFCFLFSSQKNPYLPDNELKIILCNISHKLLPTLTFCRSPVKWANSTISFPNWLNICTNSWKLLTFSSWSIVARTCEIREDTVDYQDAEQKTL